MLFLVTDFKAKASETNFLERFNDIVIDVPAEDLYYLLQTFASMAMSREIIDFDFIYCITIDLFKVSKNINIIIYLSKQYFFIFRLDSSMLLPKTHAIKLFVIYWLI